MLTYHHGCPVASTWEHWFRIMAIEPSVINFSEILTKIQNSSLTKMHLKISSAKWQPFCPDGDVLKSYQHLPGTNVLKKNDCYDRTPLYQCLQWLNNDCPCIPLFKVTQGQPRLTEITLDLSDDNAKVATAVTSILGNRVDASNPKFQRNHWVYITSQYLDKWWWYQNFQTQVFFLKQWHGILRSNWPNSQIPECTYSISHSAPFRTEMYTFLFWMGHSGIWNRSIVGFVKLVHYD